MKKMKLFWATAFLSLSMSITAFAGTWQAQNNGQWKYQDDKGNFVTGWIEDGGKSYYLDANGIMLSNTTTPDGYYVGVDGVWDGKDIGDGNFYSQQGSGDKVVSGLEVTVPSRLHITNNGDRNFSIWAHYGDKEYDRDLLVNTIGNYSGDVYLQPGREYTLEIKSSGSWSVRAYQLEEVSTDSFSGSGDYVTSLFMPSSNVYSISGNGNHNFSVWGYYGSGEHDRKLLVNEIGTYTGTVMLKNTNKNYSFFVIKCDGDWSIMPQ